MLQRTERSRCPSTLVAPLNTHCNKVNKKFVNSKSDKLDKGYVNEEISCQHFSFIISVTVGLLPEIEKG